MHEVETIEWIPNGELRVATEDGTELIDPPSMQFTGLHDKNGKEIYEGDVVKWYTDSMWKFGSIVYGDRGWEVHWYKSNPPKTEWRFGRPAIFEVQSFWPLSSAHDKDEAQIEVIGNIYENRELSAKGV